MIESDDELAGPTGGQLYSVVIGKYPTSKKAKVSDCDVWLHDLHQRIEKLEKKLEEKDTLIQTLQETVKKLSGPSVGISTAAVDSAKRWANYLQKGNKDKSTNSEVMIIDKMINETKAREEKENNIVVSGVALSTAHEQNERDKEDKSTVVRILEAIGMSNQEANIKRTFRTARASSSLRPPPIVVVFNDNSTKRNAIQNAKNLKGKNPYEKIFINPDLTYNEMQIEKALRKQRDTENDKLTLGEGRLKYGKTDDGKEFYWGIRFGKLCRIDRSTKRSFSQ